MAQDTTDVILSGLNERQKEAVTTTEGYVRVIAGAGTGKTKALTHRFAYIVDRLGISPANILCVTFTNKAAREMSARIRRMVDPGNVNDFICTYHGFCVKVLREDIHRVMYPKSFQILDAEDQKDILRKIYEELSITSREKTYDQAIKDIERFEEWKKGEEEKDYIERYIIPMDEIVIDPSWPIGKKISISYIKYKKKGFYLDFNDLMAFTRYIFDKYPDVREKWQSRLLYIMVDETQDNNDIQWALVSLLQEKHKNLFVVGDPDQAIYGWRGAKPGRLVKLDMEYIPCRTIILDENYRSTPEVLNVANCIIDNNVDRVKKNLFTKKGGGMKVVHFHAKKETDEAEWVAQTIKKKLESGASLRDIAILYRANYVSRAIEQALTRREIPYIIYGGIRFFERREIKDTLAYLRLITINDNLSFLRIVNTPSRGLGKVFLAKLEEIAESENKSYYEALRDNISDTVLDRPGARQFIELIEELKDRIESMTISDFIRLALDKSGLMEMFRKDGDEDRLENIEELIGSIILYEQENVNEDDLSLIKYLQDIALYTNIDYKKEETDFVKLMTIHQAKGLEYPFVFICGLSEGILPNYRAIRDRRREALEEERRIMYVAVTRAEKELYLTDSEGFSSQTQMAKYPSRFIFEIKDGYYVVEGVLDEEYKNEARALIAQSEGASFDMMEKYEKGQLVSHPFYGKGEVIDAVRESMMYLVKFERKGEIIPIRMDFKYMRKFEEEDMPEFN